MWQREVSIERHGNDKGIPPRILVIDDDEVDRLTCKRLLCKIYGDDLQLKFATSWEDAVETVDSDEHDIIIVDQFLGSRTGLELVESTRTEDDTRVFILLTGQESRDVDVAATRAGVADYLIKNDLTAIRLERSIRFATASMRQRRQLIRQADELIEAKTAIEAESRKHQALAEDLKRAQNELILALERAEKSEQRFKWLAEHDLLTGVPNRSLFTEKLQSGLNLAGRAGKPLALFVLNVDRFKWINDTFGQEIGDALLTQLAERVSKTIRTTDIIARLGGDEFAIILTHLDNPSSALTVAQKIIEELAQPFEINGNRIEARVSIGIATYSGGDNRNPEALMQMADVALHRAKSSENSEFQLYDQALNDQVQRVFRLKREMPEAINAGQFFLVFQPKIDLRDGKVRGLEALTRWIHPELGPISPGEFVPVAETTGQIIPLSSWIFEEACRIASSWQETGLEQVPIALNLSALQLQQADLVPWITDLLHRYTLAPERLGLEVTETAALGNLSQATTQLNRLRELGLSIAIDDFGTGYSSLALATSLPADQLKIDSSFVANMLEDPSHAAAIDVSITLAHSMGMHTVAEGVETEEQLTYLRNHDCDQAQGYLIARPLPLPEILTWLSAYEEEGGPWAQKTAPCRAAS